MNKLTAQQLAEFLAQKDPIIAAPIEDIAGRKERCYDMNVHVVRSRMVLNRRLGMFLPSISPIRK